MYEERMKLNEKIIVFTGEKNYSCNLITTGISLPHPAYRIQRQCSDRFVFEYIISGKGTLIQNNQTFYPKAGDAYILQEGTSQDYFSDPKDPWHKLWINVSGSLIQHLLTDYKIQEYCLFKELYSDDIWKKIWISATNDPTTQNAEIPLLLHELISILSKHVHYKIKENTNAQIIKNYIDTHLGEALSMELLCGLVYLSRSQVIRLFKAAYGLTPYDYIIKMRIQTAKVLLRNTAISINQIAQDLNFCSAAYFSNFFKAETGQSPREFRNHIH